MRAPEVYFRAAERYLSALIDGGFDNADGDLVRFRNKVKLGDASTWTFYDVSRIVGVPTDLVVKQFQAWVSELEKVEPAEGTRH